MFDRLRSRSPLGVAAIVAITASGTAAGAAAQRFAATQTTGSLGATAFLQTSATSSALQGEVASSQNTSIRVPFGVLGEYDAAGSTFGIGVAGISTTGYGVGAETFGTQPAIIGESAGSGAGIEAVSQNYDGLDAFTMAYGTTAVYGEDDSPSQFGNGVVGFGGNTGLTGVSFQGTGSFSESESNTPGDPAVQAFSRTPGTELFDAQVDGSDNMNYQVATLQYPSANNSGFVQNTDVEANADLQLNGDVIVTGAIFTGCPSAQDSAPAADCDNYSDGTARASNGAMVRAYGTRNAAPTMEDAGEARLVGGYAHVTLDPTFAAAISKKQAYLVFPAPQADSRGLYVTNRTPSGFDVRENAGGKSTLTFDYRIVAKPYAAETKRMAFVTPHRGAHTGLVSKRAAGRIAAVRSMIQKHRSHAKPKDLAAFTTH